MPLLAALQWATGCLMLAFALTQLSASWAGCLWLANTAGPAATVAAAVVFSSLALLAALGRALPLALVALPGATLAWHWHWLAAALLAVPQLATWLPGLAAAALARLRHG